MSMSTTTFVDEYATFGKAFTTSTDLVSISGTSEQAFLLLRNPSGSGKKILTSHFNFGLDTTTAREIIRVYKNPTVTSDGTGLTISNTLIKSSPPSSSCEAYKSPTVSANGSLLNMTIMPANQPSRGFNRFYLVEPGNSILVTVELSVGSVDGFLDIYWIEDLI